MAEPEKREASAKMTTSAEFREFGIAMVNYIADYLDNIRDRPVVPKVNRSPTSLVLLVVCSISWKKYLA